MSDTFPVSDAVKAAYEAVKGNPKVREALDFLVPDQKERLAQQVEIAKIPGYSYHEEKRAAAMAEYFHSYGLDDVHIDRHGNVSGVRRGCGRGPKILIDAHTDSVFPLYTVLEPRYDGSKVFMPGITDDASGLAGMLSVRSTTREFPPSEILPLRESCSKNRAYSACRSSSRKTTTILTL